MCVCVREREREKERKRERERERDDPRTQKRRRPLILRLLQVERIFESKKSLGGVELATTCGETRAGDRKRKKTFRINEKIKRD